MSLPIKKKRNYAENKTIKAGLHYLRVQHPAAYKHIIKIDNEGTTNRLEAIACGLHVGASDLLLAYPVMPFYALFVEVKPDGWTLTESKKPHHERQMTFINKMRACGYAAEFVVGIDELIECFKWYLKKPSS